MKRPVRADQVQSGDRLAGDRRLGVRLGGERVHSVRHGQERGVPVVFVATRPGWEFCLLPMELVYVT